MTEIEKKICLHLIQVITRIKYELADPGERDFPSILESTAKKVSSESGLADLIDYTKKVYKQYYGKIKDKDHGSEELADLDEELTNSCQITKTVSKNELKNTIKLLEIKYKHGSGDDPGFNLTEYRTQINSSIEDAISRAKDSTTHSTVLPFRALEFLNFSDTQIVRAAPDDHYIDLEWDQKDQNRYDVQVQQSFYGKGVPVVYTVLPTIRLTCESF